MRRVKAIYEIAKRAKKNSFRFKSRKRKQIHVEIRITGNENLEELAEVAEALRMAMIKNSAIRSKTSYYMECNIKEDASLF